MRALVTELGDAGKVALDACADALEDLPPRMLARVITSLMAGLICGFEPEHRTAALRALMAEFREARAFLEAAERERHH